MNAKSALETRASGKSHVGASTPSGMSNRGRYLALSAAVLGWMFDGLEMGLFPLVARPALMELMGPEGSKSVGLWMGNIHALFLIGAALGGVVFGWLGDRVGRTKAMMWSVLAYSIFSGMCAFATDPWQIGGLRFLAALGMGGEWALGVALVSEVFPDKSRPFMAGLIGAAANVGFLLIALLSLGLNSIVASLSGFFSSILPTTWADALVANGAWRLLFLLGAMPALLTFFIRVFVPESELWKSAHHQAAVKPKVGDIFKPGLLRHTVMGSLLGAVALLGTWATVQSIPSWGHKMTNGAHGVREALQIASACGAILFTIIMGILADKFNRRGMYFAMALLSLVACGILFRIPMQYGNGMLFWTFLVGGLTASFYGWLPLYLPELFPTRLRATGAGFAFNSGRVLAAGGTMISGALLTSFNEDFARMCAMMSLVYVFGLVLIWFAPETKGKPLPE
jgi:MFS transporter, SHS family, sialic acid transporter